MADYNSMGIAFHISALLICFTCIVYTVTQYRLDKMQKKIYLGMMIVLFFNTICELIIEFTQPNLAANPSLITAIEVSKYIYFAMHTMMLPLLGYYVLSITGKLIRFTPLRHIIFETPVLIIEILLLTNPIHHQGYSYNPVTLEYQRGWGVIALYVISAFYIAFFVANLFNSWRAITRRRRIALSYFLLMVIMGIVIQLIMYEARVELFAESLAYLGMILTVENESDIIDSDIGIYNRKALKIDADNLFANKMNAFVICIKIENSSIIRRITGSSDTKILTAMIFSELTKHIRRYYIYQTSDDTFVLTVINKTKESAQILAKRISDRFTQSWECKSTQIILNATVMTAEIPEELKNTEDLFNMVDGTLPKKHSNFLAGKDDLGFLLRRRDVEEAIQRAISYGGFEVYYQPTYSASDSKIFGAEALCRLRDEKMGMIYPDEFIPISEQIGLIYDVDDYVLSSVCRFIASGIPSRLGIRSINVNLSVLQCIKPGFVEHVISIVDNYGVNHSSISLEITESVDTNEYGIMLSVIKQFKQNGFRMYMDDYGTGYSNIQSLFSMDFDVIKIDKSILWGAETSNIGRVLLENNIRMLKQMNLGVLVEGVETESQLELLRELGADYVQGFLFSKPIPENELVKLLS